MEEIQNKKLRLVDPDPVTVAVTALGAIGSVVTLAAYYEHRVEKKELNEREKRRLKIQILEHTTGIESSMSKIHSAIFKLKLFIQIAQHYDGLATRERYNTVPFEFGAISLFLPERNFKEFVANHKIISNNSSKVIKSVYDLTKILYEYGIEFDEELAVMLDKLRTMSNKIAFEKMEYSEGIQSYEDLLSLARDVSIQLKNSLSDGPSNMPPMAPLTY
ncbi:MAG: hypothetical protein JXR18_01070 [Neptuniibacter sp.]